MVTVALPRAAALGEALADYARSHGSIGDARRNATTPYLTTYEAILGGTQRV